MKTQPPYTIGQHITAMLNPPGVGTCLGAAIVTNVSPDTREGQTGCWKVDYRNTDTADTGKYGDIVTTHGTSDYIATPAAFKRNRRQVKAKAQLHARIATNEGVDLTLNHETGGWRASEWLGDTGEIERGFLYPTRQEALAGLKTLTTNYHPRPLGHDAYQGIDGHTHYRPFTWQSLLDSLPNAPTTN